MNALKVEGEKGRAFEINPKNPLQKRYEISARSVARVLSEHGITLKKKRRNYPCE
jgi:transposase